MQLAEEAAGCEPPRQVDGCLRASAPDVFAVGDVAAFPHGGKPGRFEHVGCARSSRPEDCSRGERL